MQTFEEVFSTDKLIELLDLNRNGCGEDIVKYFYYIFKERHVDDVSRFDFENPPTVTLLEENIFKLQVHDNISFIIENNPDNNPTKLEKYINPADEKQFCINLTLQEYSKNTNDEIFSETYNGLIKEWLLSFFEPQCNKGTCPAAVELLKKIENFTDKGLKKKNATNVSKLLKEQRNEIIDLLENERSILDLLILDLCDECEKLTTDNIYCFEIDPGEGSFQEDLKVECCFFDETSKKQIIEIRKMKEKPYLILGVKDSEPLSCFTKFSPEYPGGYKTIMYKDYNFERRFDIIKAFEESEFIELMKNELLMIEREVLK